MERRLYRQTSFLLFFDLETGFMKLSYKKIKKYFFMDKV